MSIQLNSLALATVHGLRSIACSCTGNVRTLIESLRHRQVTVETMELGRPITVERGETIKKIKAKIQAFHWTSNTNLPDTSLYLYLHGDVHQGDSRWWSIIYSMFPKYYQVWNFTTVVHPWVSWTAGTGDWAGQSEHSEPILCYKMKYFERTVSSRKMTNIILSTWYHPVLRFGFEENTSVMTPGLLLSIAQTESA